ncbi:MAG: AI-2E family transporter [Acidobacteria bacterium]|nr:AI-2E family transporter [Acidobacteriota bacterium]
MDERTTAEPEPNPTRRALDLAIRLALVALLAYWCLRIAQPFVLPVVWGIVLAVALFPIYARLERLLGGRRKWAAGLLVLACLALIVVPVVWLSGSVLDGARFVSAQVEHGKEGELSIPPAPESVAQWPIVGPRLYETWNLAATSLQSALRPFRPQIVAFGRWLAGLARQAAFAILLTGVAVLIAAVFLVRRESALRLATDLGARLGGQRGVETVRIAGAAIGTVAKGVVGVAVIQGLLAAVGLVAAGVPGAGLWALLVMVLAVAQLPPLLVLGPAILYLVSADAGTTTLVLFALWSLLVSVSDAVLKPVMMGRNSEIPVLVILVGAIGGLILHGLLGLFVGAVVFSAGYRLFGAWMAGTAGPEPAGPG